MRPLNMRSFSTDFKVNDSVWYSIVFPRHKAVHEVSSIYSPCITEISDTHFPIPPAPGNHRSIACLHDFDYCTSFTFIHLFLTEVGLHCCTRASSSCGEPGLLASCRVQAAHCRGFSCGACAFSPRMGSAAPEHKGPSQTRNQTRVPCITRQILNHWPTREAPDFDGFK